MRRLAPAVAVVVSVLAGGCGGSSSTGSSSPGHSSSASGASSGSGSSSGSASATGGGTTGASTTGASTTGGGPTGASTTGGAGSSTSSSTTSTATADTGVRLPARFVIRADGILLPGVISAPKRTAVALTVVSEDGRAHAFLLQTPQRHAARVLPGRPLRLLLRGLPNGVYAVQVDGRVRGRLIIGATPGP